jgi:deoxyadenosine/deoxycytidine kinase
MIVAVCGPIGVGKSFLVESIGNITEFQVTKDSCNPFENYFFNDPTRWGLHQISSHIAKHFNRFNAVKDRSDSGQKFIFDQTIYEEIIYAEVLSEFGVITPEEFQLIKSLYHGIISSIKKPDVFLYLQKPEHQLRELALIRTKESHLGSNFVSEYNSRLLKYFDSCNDWLPTTKVDLSGPDCLSATLGILKSLVVR